MRRKAGSAAPDAVRLVYARSGPDADEPLVAVVRAEDEARLIEADVRQREPAARVAWETHDVVGDLGVDVHVVVQAAGDLSVVDSADPIGLAVFAERADADRYLAARAVDGMDYAVGSFPLGWRRDGWPFSAG